MHHFSKTNWSALNFLMLSNYKLMQVATKLEIKDVNTCPKLDKTVLNKSIFVLTNLCRELLYWQCWNPPSF
jgi:hypothetical protein